MAEAWLLLSAQDRGDALALIANRTGRPAHLLEKDVWVVWTLAALFRSPLAHQLVFKGGTSLSKAYGVIKRFSEDVDLTCDIRTLLPDLVGDREDALPATRSQQARWSSAVRERLPIWIADVVRPTIAAALARDGVTAELRHDEDQLVIHYEPSAVGSGYVRPSVLLEFGARSTGEPASPRDVACDADGIVSELSFPSARPRVMHAERTFWEKATAVHVFCQQSRTRGERYSRHWHDLVRLDDAGIAAPALADQVLATAVARHKQMFFAEQSADRTPINYLTAVQGALQLVPSEEGLRALEYDYLHMLQDGLLESNAESFEQLMARVADLESRANATDR